MHGNDTDNNPEDVSDLFVLWHGDQSVSLSLDPEIPERRDLLLELKSAEAAASGEDLRKVLNALTGELKAQFETFREIRLAAERALATADDETASKLAKADIKTASDAISQIVRTLEKVDNLQRSIADARAREAEASIDEAEVETMRNEFMALIEERAMELAREHLEAGGDGAGESLPDPGG